MGAAAVHVPDFINHPVFGPTRRDVRRFFELTQLNEIPQNQVQLNRGFGDSKRFDVDNRGIASMLRLDVTLNFDVGAFAGGAFALAAGWPWKLLKEIRVIANSTVVFNGDGVMCHALMCAMNDSPDLSSLVSSGVSASNGTKTIKFPIAIPLASDQSTCMGAVFLETDSTNVKVEVRLDDEVELFTKPAGSTLSNVSVLIEPTLTTSDIPVDSDGKGGLVYVTPDVTVLHAVNMHDEFISANGLQRITVSPSEGQLDRLLLRIIDDSANAPVAIDTLRQFKLRYGANQLLREQTARDLKLRNILWYGEPLPDEVIAYDLVAENSLRDSLVPKAHLGLEVGIDFGSLTVAGGDYVRVLEQVVLPSATWMSATPVQPAA